MRCDPVSIARRVNRDLLSLPLCFSRVRVAYSKVPACQSMRAILSEQALFREGLLRRPVRAFQVTWGRSPQIYIGRGKAD